MKSIRPYYHEFAWAYDLLQTENVAARVDFMQSVLAENGIASGSRVLDAGCGTGRYAAEFARRGFKASGVDRSPELITVAKGRDAGGGMAAEFVLADLLSVVFPKPFDAVLCRGVLNDFVTDVSRRSIFRQFAQWLRPGGILLFDVREWTSTALRYTQQPVHSRTVESSSGVLRFESETLLDNGSRRMLVHERFVIGGGGETSKTKENDFVMRPWTAAEIARDLHTNGLQELRSDINYGEDAEKWSDRLVITARKL